MSEILLTEQTASSVTPTAGRVVIYAKTDGYLYFKDDTGLETRVNMQVTKTAAQWVSSNPVLAEGVFGVETDTMKFKIGDGVTAWNTLAYWRYTAEHLTINTTGGSTVLTLAQARASSFAITGALVSAVNIIVQDTMALFVAENLTTGAHTVTFKTAAGGGIVVPQGAHITLYADGVKVENPVTAGAGSGDVVGPASSVSGKVAVFSGTTGKLISDSGVTLGTASASATTDFAAALGVNDNYVTDAEKTVIGNTSGANSGDNATNTQYSGLAAAKQDTLVSGTNIKTVNSTTLLGSGNISVEVAGAAATAELNAKAYADGLVVGLWDDRGAYNASVNIFPASGGSGTAGAVLKGDIWTVGAAGTLGGVAVGLGDTVRALVDTPGQTAANWALQENNIGYVPENVANKVTTLSGASTDTQYPTAKLAYDQLVLKANLNGPTFTGTVGGITAAMVGAPSGSGTSSGANTGDQASIVGITGTLAQFNTAVTDADLLGTTGVGSDLTLARIAGSTYSTIQHWRNNFASAGIIAGGVMTDAGGATINVTGGSCAIRASTSHLSTLYFADFPANNGIAIPTNTSRYVGIEYNAGAPIVAIRATDDFDYMTNFPLGVVTNEAGTLHLHTADRHDVADSASHIAERFEHTANFARDEVIGGLILGETGTRNITVSAGAVWQKLLKLTISAFNSSTGSTFDIYYRDGAGSFTKVVAATQWPNLQYDNGTGTLTTLANNKYGTLWFYLEADDSMIIMLYGRAEHGSIAAAEAEAPPATLPNRIFVGARIIGKLVFAKGAATASSISSIFTQAFATTGASSHANLSNLDYASAGHTGFVADTTKGVANGVASLDASALIPITQLPPAALERLVVVANQTARYALTITSVQNGDTVKQTDTTEMWYVIDQANLGNAAGYAVYTAGTASAVAVGGITGLGTGVATALAVAVGSAGALVANGGALGTPSSGALDNCTSNTETAANNSTQLATTAYADRLTAGTLAGAFTTLSASGVANIGSGTASSWSVFDSIAHIGSGAIASYGVSQSSIFSNAYYNAGYKFKGTGYAMNLSISSGVYDLQISNASGTANNAITWTTPVSISSTGLAVTGTITSTVPAAGAFTTLSTSGKITQTGGTGLYEASSAGTAHKNFYIANTGGGLSFGVEQSTGQILISGSGGYDSVVNTTTATNLIFGTNNVIRGIFSSTGLAVTGALSASGVITSTRLGIVLSNTTSGTQARTIELGNGTGLSYFGVDDSGGTHLFTNGVANSSVIGYTGSLVIGDIGAVRRAVISSTGLAVTGAITSTVPAAGAFTTLSASGSTNVPRNAASILATGGTQAGIKWGATNVLDIDSDGIINFRVGGATSFYTAGTFSATGALTLNNGLAVTGALSASGTLSVGHATTGIILGVDGGGTIAVGAAAGDSVLRQKVSGGTNVLHIVEGSTGIIKATFSSTGLAVTGQVSPSAHNTYDLGTTGVRWKDLWLQSGAFNGSDARLKTAIAPLTANEINAAKHLSKEIGTYQWLESVQKKGDVARHHVGFTVQRAIEILQANGCDPFAYGFIGYDKWDDVFVEHAEILPVEAIAAKETVLDADGNEIEPAIAAVEAVEGKAAWTEHKTVAGDAYSFRYDQLNMFIAAGLEARLSALESR